MIPSVIINITLISLIIIILFNSLMPRVNAKDSTTQRLMDITKSKNLSSHDLSPAALRHRRQAYPVYSASEGKLILDNVGQTESGPWENWSDSGAECSRTCGGGVKIEIRKCGGSGCVGSRKRYVSCSSEPCEKGAKDYRSEQCAAVNDKPLEGKYYKWKPYTKAPNKCELICMPEGESFYYKWADRVVDGTKCDEFSNDICVEGFCLPLGCDNKLGSVTKADKCGVCGGDGTTCKTLRGFFDEKHVGPGYVDIITLPVGAASILIEETKPTNNYLALRNESGTYYLNGNWKIDFPQTLEIAGTLFEYERNRLGTAGQEKIVAKGPLTEPVILALLYQAEHTGIAYEYTLPLEETLPHHYIVGEWSECSVTCGKGMQSRKITCVDRATRQPVDEELCANSSIPETNRTCNSIDCETEWFQGEWEQCSHTCGDSGLQYRVVYCHQVSADGVRITVDDELCSNVTRPEVKQTCNRFACPDWQSGPWSSCSKDCGSAFQYRAVTCRSEKVGEEGKLVPAKQCNDTQKPYNKRTCNLGPCEGLRWVTSDWILCSKCNDTTEYRNVTCEDANGKRFPEEKCKDLRPDDNRTCVNVIPCTYQWQSSQWSECSSQCGHGHQTRSVFCTIDEDGYLKKMDETFCDWKIKPELRQNCTHEGEKCTGTYYSSPWSACTAECGGGTQNRSVLCFDYDFKVRPQMCDENEKPDDVQDCNIEKCLACNETEFGCCPDNSTVAVGPFLEGCSNCSDTEFGCCPDNYTASSGEDNSGCPPPPTPTTSGDELLEASGDDEQPFNASSSSTTVILSDDVSSNNCSSTEFGCCPDGNTTATTEDKSDCPEVLCNYTNAAGESIQIPCVNLTETAEPSNETMAMLNDTDMMLGNDTALNGTTEVHCSKTEFGCCPDWYTPANGTDFEGCPEFEIGNCNDTKHGCCPDELTLARGPNYEGCGDPSCAASLFGCCKDRMTIAFGTHYQGCERANQPCETSKFGCCADGLTAALGTNGAGCDEDCRLTKFGCCPDGKTTSKGSNNEGCGCAASRFGCCPDGKSSADGPNFQNCPETCARSYYGCCPDGKTTAQGPQNEGCPCVYTRFGCCPDGETAARGPDHESCDDCRFWKHGCCSDGKTKALGPNRQGCDLLQPGAPKTTPYSRQAVSPNRIASCTLPKNDGRLCAEYVLLWFYDTNEGSCRQFWYGGCEGNDNRFGSEQECKDVCVEPIGTGLCYLPKIEGPQDCGNTEPRWYYDLNRGQCLPFYYRGCNGNANNFVDYGECMARCESVKISTTVGDRQDEVTHPQSQFVQHQSEWTPQGSDDSSWTPTEQRHPDDQYPTPPSSGDVCDYKMDSGPCQNYREAWFFDSYSRQCTIFQYGGCEGNPNKFHSREDCEQACRHKLAPSRPVEESVCNLPLQRGHCDERLARFYYDTSSKRCSSFIYTGCAGNENNFETDDLCKQQCETTVQEINDDVCSLEKDAGPCDNYQPKWFFSKPDGTCKRFYYGGCHGNKNRFEELPECEEHCASKLNPCLLPPVQGPCSGYTYRYHWDQNSGQCKQFRYGGCLGNANRFDNVQACEARCSQTSADDGSRSQQLHAGHFQHMSTPQAPARTPEPEKTADVCILPVAPGSCQEYNYRFFFNYTSKRCEAFIYTGCDGNDNRFEQVDKCEITCGYYTRRNIQADVLSAGDGLHLFKPIPVSLPNFHKSSVTHANTRSSTTVTTPSSASSLQEIRENENNGDICNLPPDSGVCKNMTTRWYWDQTLRQCREFNYGGCLGNLNNFESVQICQEYCLEESREEPSSSSSAEDNNNNSNSVESLNNNGNSNNNKKNSNNNNNNFETKIGSLGASPVGDVIVDERLPPQIYPLPTSPVPDMCNQPKDAGDCYESLLRYYYDSEKQKCQSFQYTNCKGNTNRFLSLEECDRACGQYRDPGVCSLPVDSGNCLASVMKWSWNQAKGICESFVYSGCGGNGNRFGSKEECESLCRKESESLSAEICALKPEVGPCRIAVPRYHFDLDSKTCKQFAYGGCQGNENNFETESACMLRCSVVQTGITDICHLSYDSGPCSEAIAQFYYDRSAQECKLFTYGGCRGNKNRFDTKMQCESQCKPTQAQVSSAPFVSSFSESICRLPVDEGGCDAKVLRYYYNFATKKCETFTYGGCSGNENKFFTEQECYETCFDMPSLPSAATILTTLPTQLTTAELTYRAAYEAFSSRHGQAVNVHCRSTPPLVEEEMNAKKIHWFHNGRPINLRENAHLSVLTNGTLHIEPATAADSGNYSCSNAEILDGGKKSIPAKIDIKEAKSEALMNQCSDDPSKANCQLVKVAGLCGHTFYGKFCCKTCTEFLEQKKSKRIKLKTH